MPKILVIDDERSIRNSLKDILEYEKHIVDIAENGNEGYEKIMQNHYDLVFCDIKMPGIDGIELLKKVMNERDDLQIVIISGHGSIDIAVDAIREGAFDFISKPLDLNRVLITVKNAFDKSKLLIETKSLKTKISSKYEIIGKTDKLNDVLDVISKVAPTDARVLITGANGTGKELVARRIHELSQRNKLPFIEVNCAAIPSELIESELFGYEKGAFTSAVKQKIGKFELADGGTIFLDEIGDMSLSAQAKVLRALQEKKISRVGGEKDITVDVRVIAATNKNLADEIQSKTFREDLFHRLSVIKIHVPSLQERKEDIPLLVIHFIKLISVEMGIQPKDIDSNALSLLVDMPWTGNIRELRNVVERLIILGDTSISEKNVRDFV
ncbi:MAG: sigma-54-dependent Fis family transcriptional regulator [Bacteroidales bacterium]|nr:sigma-54-dependent Fis family transcriptional regulator [Bacteroidales bacterium]